MNLERIGSPRGAAKFVGANRIYFRLRQRWIISRRSNHADSPVQYELQNAGKLYIRRQRIASVGIQRNRKTLILGIDGVFSRHVDLRCTSAYAQPTGFYGTIESKLADGY